MKTSYIYPVNAALLLGPTGVGKTPIGDTIGQRGLFKRTCRHLDFGSELRYAVALEERSAAYTAAELDFIHGVLERGLLLENEHFSLAKKIITLFLDRQAFTQQNVLLLNGIPRHIGQARDISHIARIHALIVLDCADDDVYSRILNNTGGDRTDRIDDDRELIEKKLAIFRDRTAPLVMHYEKNGSTIYWLNISGTSSTDPAYQQLQSLAAADPPVALVTEPPQR